MEDIIRRIEAGESYRSISSSTGIPRTKLMLQLVDYGYYGHVHFPEEQIQKAIIHDYVVNKLNMDQIARKLSISRYVIKAVLVTRKVAVNAPGHNTHHTIDHNYFSTIDTEAKAYFLGLLFADGYVDNRAAARVEITLKECDRHILEKLKEELKTNFEVTDRIIRGNHYVRLSFFSRQIVDDLVYHGCTRCKSLTLEYPKHLSTELTHHFIRGYFDGDGCITMHLANRKTTKYGRYGMRFSLVGTESFLLSCNEALEYATETSLRIARAKGKAYEAEVSGRLQLIKLYHYLYGGATIYLQRKHDIFQKVNMEPAELVIALS